MAVLALSGRNLAGTVGQIWKCCSMKFDGGLIVTYLFTYFYKLDPLSK